MWILTVFRVRECRCWGQLNYNQGLEREEKQFKNAAFCCISFWSEYRNVSRRISSIPGGWAVRRCYVCFVVFSTRNAVAGVSFLAVELVYKWAFSFLLDKVFVWDSDLVFVLCLFLELLLLASVLCFFPGFFLVLLSCSARGCFFFSCSFFLFCKGLSLPSCSSFLLLLLFWSSVFVFFFLVFLSSFYSFLSGELLFNKRASVTSFCW